MDIFVIKTNEGAFMPAHKQDAEKAKKIAVGQPCRITLRRVRNYEFHKKFFALLNLAFDYWEPQPSRADKLLNILDMPPEKNFDRFRKDVIILAGFYDASYRVDNTVRLEAKSIAFHNMSEDEFEELYTKVVDVIVKRVLTQYEGDELRDIIEQVEAFD